MVSRKNDFLSWCWPVFGRQNDEKMSSLVFHHRTPRCIEDHPGGPSGIPQESLTIRMEAQSQFSTFSVFRIRYKTVMLVGGSVGAAVGSESFLLPGEAWLPGHTGL